ncbi:armadillo-type protein [Rhodotorula diobovata]|uniref:Pumilio homology domain family member 3 n=1 Tax=Rhodotorula diobovata TaxID=5288 RepID=A0A5C5FXX8_9BASI|nr:armadillo-type protein [Rhodotorula diobovata]
MDSINSSAVPRAAIPPRLGLPRRSSFDPLSSKSSLSLGTLPPPAFGNLPTGLRSVPAIESSRRLGSVFRDVVGSTPTGDGQRTPGGSLVIGAEVFGFGKYAPKEPARRQHVTGGSVDGLDDSRVGSDWPAEFTKSTSSVDDPRPRDASATSNKGLPRLSGDFVRPHLMSSGSSVDLRPSSPATMDALRAPSRSSYLAPSSSLAHSSSDGSHDPSPADSGSSNDHATSNTLHAASTAGTSPGPGLPTDVSPSPGANPYLYPYQPPDPSPPPLGNPYFTHGMGMSPPPMGAGGGGYAPPPPRNGRVAVDPMFSFGQAAAVNAADDELSLGMRSMALNGGGGTGVAGANGLGGQHAPFAPEPYSPTLPGGPGGARDAPQRQGSLPYGAAPYYLPAGSPYNSHQELYAPPPPPMPPFGGPGFYPNDASAGNGGLDSRRGSIAPWGLPMPPFALAPEFAQAASGAASRQGSFPYGPTGVPSMPPPFPPPPGANGAYGSSHLDAAAAANGNGAPGPYGPAVPGGGPGGPYPAGPQLGQQHQIILGRGVRGMEYVAPGPVQPHGFGAGYGPDMRNLRSPLLEEFRGNRNRSWELSDLVGHIVEFSGDQLGSRHIQTKLDTASADDKSLVFAEILPNMLQLSTDVFANYVIQKFFEQGSQVQKTAMAKVLEGHVLQLSLQMYGCRVVQKALEYVLVDQQIRLVKELDGHVVRCARDAQSNHVIQRALERVPPEHLFFITDAVVGQVHLLATHPYGCRVLQRIFENCPPQQTRTLLDELHRYTQNLMQDQYGNYVVQWVLEKGDPADRSLVIAKVFGQLLPLAQQKFASNVVEKCIIYGSEEERVRLLDEVLAPAPDGSSVIKAMLVHPYANYVMQKCLHTAKGKQRDALFADTAAQLANLRKYSSSHSKHLVTIDKLLAAERERKGLPPLYGNGASSPHAHGFGGQPGFHNGGSSASGYTSLVGTPTSQVPPF